MLIEVYKSDTKKLWMVTYEGTRYYFSSLNKLMKWMGKE